MGDVTQILAEVEQGDPDAPEQLFRLVKDELRRLAGAKMRKERPGQTLQATALVHEAYLKLKIGEAGQHWNGRAHFFGAAAQAMKQILIDQHRRKKRVEQGMGSKEPLDSQIVVSDGRSDDELLAMEPALQQLESVDPEAARVVNCRFFVGLTIEETADALGVSVSTVNRDWKFAKAWLYQKLSEEDGQIKEIPDTE